MTPRHPSVDIPFSSPEGWDKLALCVHARVRARERSGGQSSRCVFLLLSPCWHVHRPG